LQINHKSSSSQQQQQQAQLLAQQQAQMQMQAQMQAQAQMSSRAGTKRLSAKTPSSMEQVSAAQGSASGYQHYVQMMNHNMVLSSQQQQPQMAQMGQMSGMPMSQQGNSPPSGSTGSSTAASMYSTAGSFRQMAKPPSSGRAKPSATKGVVKPSSRGGQVRSQLPRIGVSDPSPNIAVIDSSHAGMGSGGHGGHVDEEGIEEDVIGIHDLPSHHQMHHPSSSSSSSHPSYGLSGHAYGYSAYDAPQQAPPQAAKRNLQAAGVNMSSSRRY
jgi:hypothetical protein